MIEIRSELFRDLVAEARLAPSVHNIQPSRWHLSGERIRLFGDKRVAIPVADPNARDWWLSHGTQLEGLCIALRKRGLQLADLHLNPQDGAADGDGLVTVAEMSVASARNTGGAAEPVETRASWRGGFQEMNDETRSALSEVKDARDDCLFIDDRKSISDIALLADRAAMYFLRDQKHRVELLQWLRLSSAHPRYRLDGLNAEAMQMSALEAWGAGLVLGPLFHTLDKIGLATSLMSEASKTNSAAAIVLFHREKGEDPTISGRAFYRSWLVMERANLRGCPMSVLADWDLSRLQLARDFGILEDRSIISAFRVGVPGERHMAEHVRLPVDDLIV